MINDLTNRSNPLSPSIMIVLGFFFASIGFGVASIWQPSIIELSKSFMWGCLASIGVGAQAESFMVNRGKQ